ncbi:hypothetical protein Hhis01_01319 [Haloarcula hispanica]
MDRNYEFEMEFLIGVVAAVGGASTLSTFKPFVNNKITYVIITIAVVHIIILTIIYSVKRGSDYEINGIQHLEKGSKVTLWGTTAGSFAFLSNYIFNTTFVSLFGQNIEETLLQAFAIISQHGSLASEFGTLIISVTPVGILGVIYYCTIMTNIDYSNDIEISIVPEEIYIRPEFRESRPIAITVRNRSPKNIDCEVNIEIPDSVEWREVGDNETSSGDIKRIYNIDSRTQEILDIEFQHSLELSGKQARVLPVEVEHDYGKKQVKVTAMLENY